MHYDELTGPEQRVLGCLIEKRWTTPDQYPLSLNALRNACNQSTNRDPVTDYDEDTVFRAAQRLCQYGLARLASGHGSRATKYRHLAEECLGLDREQLAVLDVLLLRGPQTPGELKTRTERMAPIASLERIEQILRELADRGYVTDIGRRPGQKENRFGQLLGGGDVAGPAAGEAPAGYPAAAKGPTSSATLSAASPRTPDLAAATAVAPASPAADTSRLETRVASLEAEVTELRGEVAALRQTLDQLLS